MTHEMIRQLDLVVEHVGIDQPTDIRVKSGTPDWQWMVSVPQFSGEYFIAFTGSLFGCQTMQREYRALSSSTRNC